MIRRHHHDEPFSTLAIGIAATAEPIISDPVAIPIVANFTGTSFNIITGQTGSNPPNDDVADVLLFKLSGEWRLANPDWVEGGGLIGNAAGDRAKVLQPGDVVEITPEQPLLPGGGIRPFGDFDDVAGAYIGAYFENEATGDLHYGWVEVTLPSSGPGVITRYGDESVPETPIAIPDPCPAALDGSGFIALEDVVVLLATFGPCPPEGPCTADLDDDDAVTVSDLLAVLAAWGPCPR